MTDQELIDIAFDALTKAYAPYSDHMVGAALLSKDGRVFTGCNIENASYTPTVCAERVAFFKAVSEGVRDFDKIAVVGGRGGVAHKYLAPCGVCRQVMSEFCGDDFQIVMAMSRDNYIVRTLDEMLPARFKPEDLDKN